MDGSDRIFPWYILKKDVLAWSTYSFITGKSVSKENKFIKDSIADLGDFKEEVGSK